MKELLHDVRTMPIFWLSVFVPIVLIMHFMHSGSQSLMFLLSLLAIIPLAGFLSHATEGIAAKTGDTIGGLLNATLGNLTELVIIMAALRQGMFDLVKASLAGAVVTNTLFMLGISYLIGGLKYKVQEFNRLNAFVQASLLFVVCVALIIPSILGNRLETEGAQVLSQISLGNAVVIMAMYVLTLLFSLKTHSEYFKSPELHVEGERHWPVKLSLGVLAVAAVCIAIVSEIFVESIQETAAQVGLSEMFVGFIIIPIVGAAAEMMAAFSAARKNRLDISVGIALGSSTQIALFITPLLIFLSYSIAPAPMDLVFAGGQVFMILMSTLTIALIATHGKSTWYLGALLVTVYLIFGIALFFLK